MTVVWGEISSYSLKIHKENILQGFFITAVIRVSVHRVQWILHCWAGQILCKNGSLVNFVPSSLLQLTGTIIPPLGSAGFDYLTADFGVNAD